jgi:hypothetical protein
MDSQVLPAAVVKMSPHLPPKESSPSFHTQRLNFTLRTLQICSRQQPCRYAYTTKALGHPGGNWKASVPALMPCPCVLYSTCKTLPASGRQREGSRVPLMDGSVGRWLDRRSLVAMHILSAAVTGVPRFDSCGLGLRWRFCTTCADSFG